MPMWLKLVLSCAGTFIGGAGAYFQSHSTDPFNSRFWVGLAFAGLIPLGSYFVGLYQQAPWEPVPPVTPKK